MNAMGHLQTLVNGIVLGALYASLAVGFSLVWGVLNIVNMLHGSLIILGGYITYFAWHSYGIHPLLALPAVALLMYGLGYVTQLLVINRVVHQPVLVTMTLTFGLDLILYNFMTVYYTATPRRVTLDLGAINIGGIAIPFDRLLGMVLALVLTGLLYVVMRRSRVGRAIVAVRLDRDAAVLMGVNVEQIYAIAFGLGAALAGCAGVLMALIFPISPLTSSGYLGKAFVVCVLGGLGSVSGALAGGLLLALVEGVGSTLFGPSHATTLSFVLLIVFLILRPQGLLGRKGFE
jgi:branched-chain amino acid transport system permease protein